VERIADFLGGKGAEGKEEALIKITSTFIFEIGLISYFSRCLLWHVEFVVMN